MPHADRPIVRVVIAEHLTMVRDALRLVLESEGRITVVGEASDGDEAVCRAAATGPDVLLLDSMMPRVVEGLDALGLLRKRGETSVRTVVLTEAITGTEVVTALQLGAHGVVLKSALPSVLLDCVRAVARGDFWIDNDGVHALARAVAIALAKTQPSAAARAETLTARQRTGLSAGIGLPKAGADDALHDRGDGEFAGVDTGVGRRVAYPSITAA